MRTAIVLLVVGAFALTVGSVPAGAGEINPRKIIDLNGTWQVAEGTMDSIPKQFEHKVPVPGLVDMAKPAFAEVGKKSDKRQAFWYQNAWRLSLFLPTSAKAGLAISTRPGTGTLCSNCLGIESIVPSATCHVPFRSIILRGLISPAPAGTLPTVNANAPTTRSTIAVLMVCS